MQLGLVISVLLHAAILGWTLISIQSQRHLHVPETEPVAVGMIAPSEVTKVRLGVPTAKQPEAAPVKESPKGDLAKKEAPKAKLAAAAPAPPPPPPEQKADPIAQKLAEPPAPAPAPLPSVPAAEAQKKLEAELQKQVEEQKKAEEARQAELEKQAEKQRKADEQKRAEEQKRLEEERRQAELKRKEAELKRREAALKKKREEEEKKKKRQDAELAAKKKQFDADNIAALLNKVPDAAPPPPSEAPTEPTKAKGPALGSAEGKDKQISASEMAMLNGIVGGRLNACWKLPSAGGGSDTPVVTLRWRLKPDGSLDGDPVVVERSRNDILFQLAAEAAIRAVRECAPFPLPRDKYYFWKTITRDFDPRAMIR